MCKLCEIVVATLLICASSTVAQAQWATHYVEHDWCLEIGNQSYGVMQVVQQPGDWRTTSIHLGSLEFKSRLQAVHIAGIAVLLFAGIGVLWWRSREGRIRHQHAA